MADLPFYKATPSENSTMEFSLAFAMEFTLALTCQS
jgi:hypothetical protein